MKKIVSFLLVLVLVFSSFSMVFAFDINKNTTYYGFFSKETFTGNIAQGFLTNNLRPGIFTFEQCLDFYLTDCQTSIGYGTVVSSDDLIFIFDKNLGGYALYYAYNYGSLGSSLYNAARLIWDVAKGNDPVIGDFASSFKLVKNSQGYCFGWNPNDSHVYIFSGRQSSAHNMIENYSLIFRFKTKGTNSLLPSDSSSAQGVSQEFNFYQDYEELQNVITSGINDSELVSILKKIYNQGSTQKGSTIDVNGNLDLPDYSPSISHDYLLAYSPTTTTYYNIDQSDNRQYNYTISNEYNYQYINYYMPGSDVPFQSAELYFELPDGRNSADLTYDEIKGMNIDFDCVNYTQVAVDPYQQALFHFDGNIDSDGVNNPLVESSSSWSYNTGNFEIRGFNGSYTCPTISHPGTYTITVFETENGARYKLNNGSNQTFYSSFTLYLNAGDVLVFSTSRASDYIRMNVKSSGRISSWTTSTAILNTNPVTFEFTDNPIYTFVETGSQYFDSALYLDGLSHDFKVNMATGSVISMFDYTYSFRWYQELSTDTQVNTIYIGGNADNNSDSYLKFDGSKFTALGNRGSNKALNETIPVGSWNTISLVRSGTNILFFLNGNLIDTLNGNSISSSPYHDYITWHLAGNNLVRYLDEMMFTDIALYTSNFVPRSQPYDSGVALVLPQGLNSNTLAIHSHLPVSKYQFGGVRSTMPVYGEVYVFIENNQIKSIQQWNGYMWIEVSGMVYFGGHWYSLQSFTIGTIGSQFDISDNPSGSGSTQEQEKEDINFLNLIYKLLSGVIDLIVKLFNSFVDLVERIFAAIGNLIFKLLEGIGNFTFDLSPVESVSTGFWAVLPSWFKGFFTSAFTILIAIAVFAIFK